MDGCRMIHNNFISFFFPFSNSTNLENVDDDNEQCKRSFKKEKRTI